MALIMAVEEDLDTQVITPGADDGLSADFSVGTNGTTEIKKEENAAIHVGEVEILPTPPKPAPLIVDLDMTLDRHAVQDPADDTASSAAPSSDLAVASVPDNALLQEQQPGAASLADDDDLADFNFDTTQPVVATPPPQADTDNHAGNVAPRIKTEQYPEIILISNSSPPSSPRDSPYSILGTSMDENLAKLRVSCYRELRESVNQRCKGNYRAPPDLTLVYVANELPKNGTELEDIPGMPRCSRFIFNDAILKITKRYRTKKREFAKSCILPLIGREYTYENGSTGENSSSRRRKRNSKGSGKRRTQAVSEEEAEVTSHQESPAPKRTRGRSRPRRQQTQVVSDDDTDAADSGIREPSPPPRKRTRAAAHRSEAAD